MQITTFSFLSLSITCWQQLNFIYLPSVFTFIWKKNREKQNRYISTNVNGVEGRRRRCRCRLFFFSFLNELCLFGVLTLCNVHEWILRRVLDWLTFRITDAYRYVYRLFRKQILNEEIHKINKISLFFVFRVTHIYIYTNSLYWRKSVVQRLADHDF